VAAREKRSMTPSPTGPQRRSRDTTIPSERVLVKPMSRVVNSRRDGEAGPGSKSEAGYEEPSKCDRMLIRGPGDGSLHQERYNACVRWLESIVFSVWLLQWQLV